MTTTTEEANGNGQTVASLKRIKDQLQFNVPSKYAVPIILSLLGLSGYAYRDSIVPGVNAQEQAIKDLQEEAKRTREETIVNRAAVQNLTTSVDRLTQRIDRILERDRIRER